MKRYLPALLLALANIAAAPFMGQLRNFLLATFPGSFIRVMAGLLALLFLALLVAAFRSIRSQRAWRYACLVGALALVAIQTFVFDRGILEVDVVEKVHFLQYGLLAYLLYRAFLPAKDVSVLARAWLWTVLAGTLEEGVQWTVPVRTGEYGDVLLNAYAAVCGLLFGLALRPLEGALRRKWPARHTAIVLRTLALTLLVFGVFFHCAHLGYRIETPETGRFLSWFSEKELLAAKADRAARWATDPPRRLKALAKEDLFLTEAGWHVHRRNTALGEADYYTAWKESKILERFYEPFLDIPPLPGTGNYRLHPNEMTSIAEGRPQPDPHPYRSPVLSSRIFAQPSKPLFWSGLGCLLAFLLLLARRFDRQSPTV